jgi:hypothetical protein
VHIDLWQVMKEGTGTRTGSTKALMGGIKEWQTSFNTYLANNSFIHSSTALNKHHKFLWLLFPQGFFNLCW